MTRCADFYEKWKKDPNWCEKSPETTRLIDHYLELVSVLESHGVELAAIYKKFPEDAARGVFKVKDKSLKEEVIKNIIGKLKRGEKVTNSDISTWAGIERKAKKPTIVGSLTPDSEVKKSNILEKPDSSPAAPVSEFVTGTQIRDGTAPDPAQDPHALSAQIAGAVPPVPPAIHIPACKGGGGCPYPHGTRQESARGVICIDQNTAIGQISRCLRKEREDKVAQGPAPVDTGFANGNGKKDLVVPKAPETATKPPTNERELCEAFLRVVLDNGPEADFVRRLADTEFDGDIAQAEREIHIRAAAGGA